MRVKSSEVLLTFTNCIVSVSLKSGRKWRQFPVSAASCAAAQAVEHSQCCLFVPVRMDTEMMGSLNVVEGFYLAAELQLLHLTTFILLWVVLRAFF